MKGKIIYAEYRCRKCKHIEEMPIKKRIFFYFNSFFLTIGIAAMILFFATYFISPVNLSNAVGSYAGFFFTLHSQKPDLELRKMTLPAIKNCENNDLCVVNRIFYLYFNNTYAQTPYQNSIVFEPKYVLETDSADCKSFSYSFNSVVSQYGIDCKIICNECHCYNICYLEDENVFIDVTSKTFIIFDKNDKSINHLYDNLCD